jgi:3-hydroxyacyl-CoA dehydrogenase, NAD binding domain
MLDSAWTAAEMEQEIWTHQAPTQARSPATTDLKAALADADLVQENGPERKDFKIKLFADMDAATRPDTIIASAIGYVTDDLFADMNRFLANRFIESDRALDGFWRCFFACYYFYEWHDVGRVEGMADDTTLGMLTGGLHGAHGQSGGT